MHFALPVIWQALSKQESQNKGPKQFCVKICNVLRCGYWEGIITKKTQSIFPFPNLQIPVAQIIDKLF